MLMSAEICCPPRRVDRTMPAGYNALSAYAAMIAPLNCAIQYTTAIIGSMRRVTRKPAVTAGFRWPEMRMVAVTMSARISPCANAMFTTAACNCSIGLVMIAPPPTNTRANVPMNSAAKWRQASFIWRWVEGGRSRECTPARARLNLVLFSPTHHQCRVDSAEAERIIERVVDARLASRPRDIVQIAALVGIVEVERGRQPASFE